MNEADFPLFCNYENLTAIANHWIEIGWRQGDVAALDILHAPDFVDRDPSDRFSFSGIEIICIEKGLILERWGEWDGIDLLHRLGKGN